MNKLIACAKELVKEAEAIGGPRPDQERKNLPVTDYPKSWWPATYSEAFCGKFISAVVVLYSLAKAIRDEGFARVTVKGLGAGACTPQELQEAIHRVERLLESI